MRNRILLISVILGVLFGWYIAGATASSASLKAPTQCSVVSTLQKAGFKGHNLRVAYGVVMRESKGMNLSESSPWYSGALGIFQVQTSAHRNKPWWSRSAMLNPQRQARIVYKHMTNRGTYWRPWGLTSNGLGMDTSHFRSWSSWQHYNWIWAPYKRYYDAFPWRCVRK